MSSRIVYSKPLMANAKARNLVPFAAGHGNPLIPSSRNELFRNIDYATASRLFAFCVMVANGKPAREAFTAAWPEEQP